MARRIQVKAGERYGRLSVIEEVEPHKAPCGQSYRRFACNCDCGASTVVQLSSLRMGLTNSCGCLQKEHAAENGRRNATHGMDGTPTHKAWLSMRQRCLCPTHQYYNHYGGRGVAICQRWLDSFEAFLKDMGVRPDGRTLDRIDNEGNYKPGNCRWATQAQQNRNMRKTRLLSHNGETLCLAEWSRRTGLSIGAITGRLKAGLSTTDALTVPAGIRRLADYGKKAKKE